MALTPGSERYNILIEKVERDLEKSLPMIGVILDTEQPIVLIGRDIPHKIIEAIERGQGRDVDTQALTKYVERLQNQFPGVVPNAVLAQILTAIEGIDVGKRLILEQEGSNSATEFELKMHDGAGGLPETIIRPEVKAPETEVRRPPALSESDKAPVRSNNKTLSKSDLAVLKRLPRPDSREKERMSA
jgi:hypothetical protein